MITRTGPDSGAIFSDCERYRYALWRDWSMQGPICAFVGLNPSTATHEVDDPTIRRCRNFARSWGFPRLVMLNLFGLRSTDPRGLKQVADPVGADADAQLVDWVGKCGLVVAAWGVHGTLGDRDCAVQRLLRPHCRLHVLGLTKAGHPKHPLYLRADLTPEPWKDLVCQ